MPSQFLSGVKNIIIDMGGVILDIDYTLTAKAFEKMGVPDFEKLFTQANQSVFIEEFERGNLSPEEFRKQVCKLTSKSFEENEIDKAWNALILEPKISRIASLRALSACCDLYLLSNNNAIHYNQCIATINTMLNFEEFSSLFKKSYYSHLIKQRKPDAASFEYVLQENNLNKEETVFWDDSVQHLAAAAALGLRTQRIDSQITIDYICQAEGLLTGNIIL